MGFADTLHSLRHRFGTLTCEEEGIRTTMGIMGHQRITSTVIYVAFNEPAGRRAVEALPVPRKARRLKSAG
jgi:integrase